VLASQRSLWSFIYNFTWVPLSHPSRHLFFFFFLSAGLGLQLKIEIDQNLNFLIKNNFLYIF
jgi:hypothetical protein